MSQSPSLVSVVPHLLLPADGAGRLAVGLVTLLLLHLEPVCEMCSSIINKKTAHSNERPFYA